jgi:hypothetical protein
MSGRRVYQLGLRQRSRGRLYVIRDRRRGDTLQDGRRDVDIDLGEGEILRGKSDAMYQSLQGLRR